MSSQRDRLRVPMKDRVSDIHVTANVTLPSPEEMLREISDIYLIYDLNIAINTIYESFIEFAAVDI
jgi:hypothetical protein